MADAAHIATDKELERIEKKLTSIYKRAEKEIGQKWTAYVQSVEADLKPLQAELAKAQKANNQAEIKRLQKEIADKKRARTVMDGRYKRLTNQIANEISKVNQTALDYVNGKTPNVYTLNYNYVAEDLNGLNMGISFELVDANTVKRLALDESILLPSQAINHAKDVAWNVHKTNSEVLQGILQGESMPKIAKRFASVMGMNAASAIRNARTAVTSAENGGRMDMMHEAQEKGVMIRKRWIATHDERTRDAHMELDDVIEDVDKPFVNALGEIMYPADPHAKPANVYNCRCSLGYEIVGFNPKIPISFTVKDIQFG